MASATPVRHALPNFRTARLIGIFNVVFSTAILCCGLMMGLYVASMPLVMSMLGNVQKQAERQMETRREAELAAADARIKAAKTTEEQVEALASKKAIEQRPAGLPMSNIDLNGMGLNNPVAIGWSWAEVLTGLALNVMMLISGIGLLHWKGWARRLCVWTMSLKVLRLFVLYAVFIVLVVPPVAKNLGEMVVKMSTQQGMAIGATPGQIPPATFFTRVYTIMYSGMGVGMIVLGSVYPIVMLVLLTRPGVVTACSGVFHAPKEPGQPW